MGAGGTPEGTNRGNRQWAVSKAEEEEGGAARYCAAGARGRCTALKDLALNQTPVVDFVLEKII
jgi:hypothetical protein